MMKMCDGVGNNVTKQMDPALELALLLTNEMGLSHQVSTTGVRRLIRTKWDQLTKLAHAVHAEEIAKNSELRKAVRNILALSEDGVVAVVEGKAYMAPARRDDFFFVAEAIKRASE